MFEKDDASKNTTISAAIARIEIFNIRKIRKFEEATTKNNLKKY